MNYIVTKTPSYFNKIGDFNFCSLEEMDAKLPDTIACDSECTSLKAILGDMFCIQFGTGKDNFIVHMYDDNYYPEDIKTILLTKELIFQNSLYDLHFLAKYGIYPPKVRDTFLASKLIYNGIKSYRHGFADIFKREMGIIYDTAGEKKKEAAAMSDDEMLLFSFNDLEDEMSHEDDIDKKTQQKLIAKNKLSTLKAIKYCFQDVDRLIELHDVLLKKIDEGGFRGTYDLHCRYIRALAYMEHCGLPINVEKWKAKIAGDVEELEKHTQIVTEYIFDNLPQFRQAQIDMFDTTKKLDVKLTSPTQMLKVFKAFGINVKGDDGKESIAENVLNLSDHEFIPIWLDFQEASHTVTTFGANILDKVINGRIYTSFNPILDTARISTGRGDVNVLNMPQAKRTRECIECVPGHSFIVADYDSQEVRVSADLTQDSALISSILNGDCLHCAFARVLNPELQGLSDDEIKKNHGDKRSAAKSPRFCLFIGCIFSNEYI